MRDQVAPSGGEFWADADVDQALERFRTLVEMVDDGVYQLDADGRFVAVNDAIVELTGYARADLLGEHASLVIADEDVGRIRREIGARLADGTPDDEPLEFTARTADGTDIPCELELRPLVEDDSFQGTIGIARDVTDRKRRERALHERERELQRKERRYEAVFEDPNILVGLLDPDGRVRDINGTAMAYVDTDLEALLGEPFWETPWWGTGDDVESSVREWTERAAAGEYVEFEADLTRPDGEPYTISGSFRPVTDDDGAVTSIIVSDRDVTERKEHERELELFRTLLDYSSDSVLVIDPRTGRYLDVNETACERHGYSREAFLDLTVPDIETEIPDSEAWTTFVEELRDERRLTFDGHHRRADGTTYPVEVSVSYAELDQAYVLAISRDAAERRDHERRLERSERRYRTLAENFPNGAVSVYDRDLRFTLAQGSVLGDTLPGSDEIEGRTVADVYPSRVVEDIEPLLRAAVGDGESGSATFAFGDRHWRVWATPLRDAAGEIFAGLSFAQDITEQVERERYLADAKSQLEAATEAGAVGTWEWHIPEDEMIVGASFSRTFGLDPERAREGVSLDRFIDAIHAEDRDRVTTAIEEAVETGGEYEEEYRVWNADGELRWVVARGHVECDADGEPIRFPGALTDITERKRAELELQRSNDQLETLFSVLPVGVVVAEADGEIVEANETAREIWGGDVFDAESVREYERYPVRWADSGASVAPEEMTLARVVDGEEVTEPDVFEIDPVDGEHRIVEAEGMPIRDETGEVIRGVVTMSDVTARREYERKLEASNERLEQFAYAASHDLQEPLRMVTSYLSLIESRYADELDEEAGEFIDFAVDGAERMREMIEGLLAYSRVESGGKPLEPTDLNAVLDDVLDDLRLQIEESDAEITAASLPTVEGDASQLRQVFQNLLDNAIEYGGEDPPRVDITAERSGDRWTVAVSDEGIGIDAAYQDDIFEVFNRLHSADEHAGTGIGLALCNRIVERHGGDIWVDSEPGDGATFRFTLPAANDRDRI